MASPTSTVPLKLGMIEQEQVLGLLSVAQHIAGTEVGRASAEQSIGSERIVAAAGSKFNLIDKGHRRYPIMPGSYAAVFG